MTRLTIKRLEAMRSALTAMLAGEDGEGDWPENVKRDDLEAVDLWAAEELAKRRARLKVPPLF